MPYSLKLSSFDIRQDTLFEPPSCGLPDIYVTISIKNELQAPGARFKIHDLTVFTLPNEVANKH